MKPKPTLTLNHMYSQSLNIYGDLGNILALEYWAKQTGIDLQVVHTEIGGEFIEADIYFIGGGQDLDQIHVYEDLLRHKTLLLNEVQQNKIFLLICGGYQLFGKYFVDANGNNIEGLGILDLQTRALNPSVEARCIGDIIVELSEAFVAHWNIDINFSEYILGFENHGGQTKFDSATLSPIGKVIKGFGNNSHEKLEGCMFKNIIGSYCHGSLLPKNPHLALALLQKAYTQKYDKALPISNLDFELERKAHQNILKRK